jgi:hypothetical protein
MSDIMDSNAAEEELNITYKSFEDVISRKMYSWSGIPDERVSASLHKFLEQDMDMEVCQLLLVVAVLLFCINTVVSSLGC